MRPLHVTAAAVAVSLLAAVPAGATGSFAQVLAGTTTVTTTRSAATDLVLLRDAVIRFEPDGSTRDISVSGGGRIVGAWLTGAGSDALAVLRVQVGGHTRTTTDVAGTTYPRPAACTAQQLGAHQLCPPAPVPKYAVLHQGRYRLVVLTDGRPLTVRLSLHGVSGSSRLRVTRHLNSGVRPITALEDPTGRYLRVEAAADVPVDSTGILALDADFTRGTRATAGYACSYAPGPAAPTDYAPYCPGGTLADQSGLILNPVGYDYDPGVRHRVSTFALSRGNQRIGYGVTDTNPVTFRGGALAWLETDPTR